MQYSYTLIFSIPCFHSSRTLAVFQGMGARSIPQIGSKQYFVNTRISARSRFKKFGHLKIGIEHFVRKNAFSNMFKIEILQNNAWKVNYSIILNILGTLIICRVPLCSSIALIGTYAMNILKLILRLNTSLPNLKFKLLW